MAFPVPKDFPRCDVAIKGAEINGFLKNPMPLGGRWQAWAGLPLDSAAP
jgi:hypothetical protein